MSLSLITRALVGATTAGLVFVSGTGAALADEQSGSWAEQPFVNGHTLAVIPDSEVVVGRFGPAAAQTIVVEAEATHMQVGTVTVKVTVYDHPLLCTTPSPPPLNGRCGPPDLANPAVGGNVYLLPNQTADAYGNSNFVVVVPGTHPAGAEVQIALGFLNIPNADNGKFPKAISFFTQVPAGPADGSGSLDDE